MAQQTSSLKQQPSMQNVLFEWFRPLLNRMALLNETLLPFQTRTQSPLSCEAWMKAYEHISVLLHGGELSHDGQYDLWYCIVEAGLVDFNKMQFTKDEALRCADAYETVFDILTQHPCGIWLSLMFDEIAFVYRGQFPYADKVRERFDITRLLRLLEQAVINFNILTSCYEYVQQRREGRLDAEPVLTNFSVPGLSLIFYAQGSKDDKEYQKTIMERIAHECKVQIG